MPLRVSRDTSHCFTRIRSASLSYVLCLVSHHVISWLKVRWESADEVFWALAVIAENSVGSVATVPSTKGFRYSGGSMA